MKQLMTWFKNMNRKRMPEYIPSGTYEVTKKWVLVCITALIVSSCNVNPALDDLKTPQPETIKDRIRIPKGPIFLTSVSTLDKVDLMTDIGTNLTGTVTVEIRNGDGSVVIGSTTVPAGTLAPGQATNTFYFSPALSLTPGEKYRIYITRSDQHNYNTNNYIFWRTSSGGVDAYPGGINDVHPSWTLDYAFTTYNGGLVDQQQLLRTYGFFVSSGLHRWQEFVPSVPKVVLTYVDLNFLVGNNATGTLTVQIRSADGAVTLGSHTVQAASLPVGQNWVKFKFGATLDLDTPYAIYVIRSDAHDIWKDNTIYWRTSSGGTDAYPDGINDVHPSWTLDYAFRTYSSITGVDQQQNLATYGFALGNNQYRWQQFIPRNP